jgi:MoaA/NifB/PqqE/SkfB family radical SAM enzyme
MTKIKGRFPFLLGLLAGKPFIGPAWVALDVTRRCNNVCLGCFSHCIQPRDFFSGNRDIQDIPLSLVRKLSKELWQIGTSEVVLLGEGEPLLHPQYFEIVSSFKGAGLKTQTVTNGILLDKRAAQRLVETAQDLISVTFWAVNKREHEVWHPGISVDALQKRRNGLELILRAREAAHAKLPELRIMLPLNRFNIGNLEERVQLVIDSGCRAMEFGFFRDWGGRYEDQCMLPSDSDRYRAPLLRAKERFESAGILHNTDEYLARMQYGADAWLSIPCYVGWYHSSIKVDGTVFPCGHCSLAMGNAFKDDFAGIWNGPIYNSFRQRSSNPGKPTLLRGQCDCVNCCNWKDNRRVHRVFRWFRRVTLR